MRKRRVYVSSHAIDRARSRLGWTGPDAEIRSRLAQIARHALGADPPRRSANRPRWACDDTGRDRIRAPRARRAVWRYVWPPEEDKALLLVQSRGDWHVVTVLVPAADTSRAG